MAIREERNVATRDLPEWGRAYHEHLKHAPALGGRGATWIERQRAKRAAYLDELMRFAAAAPGRAYMLAAETDDES